MKRVLKKGVQLGLYSLILAGAACGQNSQDGPPEAASEPAESVVAVSGGDSHLTDEDKSITELVSGAITDLATREGVTEAEISVNRASLVTWGSSASGCPQPDMSYTQELVPGMWVVLTLEGDNYYYHGRLGADLFYCPKDRIEAPIKASKDDVM